MNFTLSEEQEMIKKMARDFLEDKCPRALVKEMEADEKGNPAGLWREMAGLGWMGLALPERYGGGDMTFLDLAILLEEMGRACLPGPFFSTVVLGALPLLELGSDEQKDACLPGVAGGEKVFTLALNEADGGYDAASINAAAVATGDDYVISGSKLFVPDAHIADYIICAARTAKGSKPEDGITLFLVEAGSPGISVTALKTISGEKLCEVVFDKVKVPAANILGKPGEGWAAVQDIVQRAAVAKCCQVVGGLQQVLEMTVDYAKERKQFGRPIGSFQVIQHYCASMMSDVDGSRFATYQAAWLLSEGLPCRQEVAVAKAWVSDVCRRVIALAHQIHGAIGVTMDHDLQFYTRRFKAAETAFGDADFHREAVAQGMGL